MHLGLFRLSYNFIYKSDIYVGYGIIYEVLGDQSVTNNDITNAVVWYEGAIEFLDKAINLPAPLNFRDINEVKMLLSQVESKKSK